GRRYYWRVRACGPNGCSAYAEVRYLDVGRVPGDVNGDGYPDLLVGMNEEQITGRVMVYLSGPSGLPTTPSIQIAPPPGSPAHFWRSGEIVGDLDGDGFADAVISDEATTGTVYVYRGSPSGLATLPSAAIPNPDPSPSNEFFGNALVGVG